MRDRFSKASSFLLTLLAAGLGFLVGTRFTGVLGILAPVIGAIMGTYLMRLYRARHRDKRLAAIEEQFPDALDFLGRSVRAGNAFSISLELLADEANEPVKSEIRKLTREMALGAGLEAALYGLVGRVPLLEVRMFVAAVLLQRETGGNLSEVLSKLAISVRERMRLAGHVKAVSGQGRLTAKVLTFLPIVTLLLLKVVSPTYVNALLERSSGPQSVGRCRSLPDDWLLCDPEDHQDRGLASWLSRLPLLSLSPLPPLSFGSGTTATCLPGASYENLEAPPDFVVADRHL